jgi:hypothetical protein
VVPGSRRAMHELAPGGQSETFRNGLLGLLHDNDSGERSGSEQETPSALARGKWAAAQDATGWGKPRAPAANQPRSRARNAMTLVNFRDAAEVHFSCATSGKRG